MLHSALISIVLLLTTPFIAHAETMKLADLKGNSHALTEYIGQGQWTIVMIWASDCGICNKEAVHLEAFHAKHKDLDGRILGISMDGLDGLKEARDFVTTHGLTFTNLVGDAEEVAVMYYDITGTYFIGTPSFLFFDRKGEIRAYLAGAVDTPLIEQYIQEQDMPKTGGASS